MAESWRDRKGVVAALAAAALAVWGAVGWSVLVAAGDDGPQPIVTAPPARALGGSSDPTPYIGPVRDPFEPLADLRPQRGPALDVSEAAPVDPVDRFAEPAVAAPRPYEPPPPPPPPDPPWQLRGLVGDRALFEGPTGESVLVREGDRIGEILVYEVTPAAVTLRTNGYDFIYDAPPAGRRAP